MKAEGDDATLDAGGQQGAGLGARGRTPAQVEEALQRELRALGEAPLSDEERAWLAHGGSDDAFAVHEDVAATSGLLRALWTEPTSPLDELSIARIERRLHAAQTPRGALEGARSSSAVRTTVWIVVGALAAAAVAAWVIAPRAFDVTGGGLATDMRQLGGEPGAADVSAADAAGLRQSASDGLVALGVVRDPRALGASARTRALVDGYARRMSGGPGAHDEGGLAPARDGQGAGLGQVDRWAPGAPADGGVEQGAHG